MTKRVALVTGGVGELGRAICERLASQNCRIVAVDISIRNGAGEWQDRMRAAGHELALVQGDVTCFDSCAAAVTTNRRRVDRGAAPAYHSLSMCCAAAFNSCEPPLPVTAAIHRGHSR